MPAHEEGNDTMTTKQAQKPELPPLDLVGRCFHIFGEGAEVQYEGVVRGALGDGHFLIQYFECFDGTLNTMAVVHMRDMVQPREHRAQGAWQFYENAEHMRGWSESYGSQRRGSDDD
jgi:hypothetical protein